MKPWLILPPKWAHDLAPIALPFFSLVFGQKTPQWESFDWQNIHFKNPLGIAGGVDKNAENISDWINLGSGFVEIGTVTPLPQDANPGKIMARDLNQNAMWNRMGFPSHGASEVLANLIAYEDPDKKVPLFVNIGKNRNTPNEDAVLDYLTLINRLHSVADVFVVNISSPNTKGLRELQKKENLQSFLGPLVQKSHFYKKPILVKLSPDMPSELLSETIQNCVNLELDGFVLTNTTLSRDSNSPFPSEGGVSGKPLQKLSEESLKICIDTLGQRKKDKLVVSVGGIMTPQDVERRLSMGADLVQVYSALIFEGPGFFHKVAAQYTNDRQHD